MVDPCEAQQGTPIPRKQLGKHRGSFLILQEHSLETKPARPDSAMCVSPSGGKSESAEPTVSKGCPALKCWLAGPVGQVALGYFHLKLLILCCEGHHRIKTFKCKDLFALDGEELEGRMEIISCPDYKLVAIRKILLVHQTQELGFLQPCKPSAHFSLCIPPKGIFKAEWRQLSFFIVLILTWSQMLLLCKPLALFLLLITFLVSLLL